MTHTSCSDQNRDSLDADIFIAHCPKNVPITHVDCSPMDYLPCPNQNCPIVGQLFEKCPIT